MNQNCYYTVNGFIIHNLSEVPPNAILQKHYRLCGGKGGFGSMLRAIGSQIEKTTNREMCRDLNGRRMRDVNNEKRLKEWLDSADSREREKLESYLEKRRKRKLLLEQGPSAKLPFEEKSAEEQRKQIAEELQDAINEAFEHKKTVESKVKLEVKPKKISLNVDSDIESSSSSSSSPIASIDIEESDILKINDTDQTKTNVSLDVSEQVAESDDELSQNSSLHFCEEIPSKKIKISVEQVTPEVVVENTTKVIDSIKEITFSPIDLNTVGSVTHLLTYGSDWIKHDLMHRGLKCGGTLMERAERLFSVKGMVEYPSNLLTGFVKNKRK